LEIDAALLTSSWQPHPAMKFVLHLKHWQLFLITFGLPMAAYIVMFVVMILSFATGKPEPPGMRFFIMFGVVGLLLIASAFITVCWLFMVATGLHKKLPEGVPMKIKRFYFAFFYPMVYIVCLMVALLIFVGYVASQAKSNDPRPFFALFSFIMPLHLLAMACGFYILYFVAKSLKSVELKKEAVAGEYIAEFVLLWFSFIGIWFIQPRINQIFAEKTPEIEGAQYLK
jgi:hypothetical protein